MHDDHDVAERVAGCEWFRTAARLGAPVRRLRERATRVDEAIRLEPVSARSPNVERAHRERRVA